METSNDGQLIKFIIMSEGKALFVQGCCSLNVCVGLPEYM